MLVLVVAFSIVWSVYGSCVDAGSTGLKTTSNAGTNTGEVSVLTFSNNQPLTTCENEPTTEGFCCKLTYLSNEFNIFIKTEGVIQSLYGASISPSCVRGKLKSNGSCEGSTSIYNTKDKSLPNPTCKIGSFIALGVDGYSGNYYCYDSLPQYTSWFNSTTFRSPFYSYHINYNYNINITKCYQNEYSCSPNKCCLTFDGRRIHDGNPVLRNECFADEVGCGTNQSKDSPYFSEVLCCRFDPNLPTATYFKVEDSVEYTQEGQIYGCSPGYVFAGMKYTNEQQLLGCYKKNESVTSTGSTVEDITFSSENGTFISSRGTTIQSQYYYCTNNQVLCGGNWLAKKTKCCDNTYTLDHQNNYFMDYWVNFDNNCPTYTLPCGVAGNTTTGVTGILCCPVTGEASTETETGALTEIPCDQSKVGVVTLSTSSNDKYLCNGTEVIPCNSENQGLIKSLTSSSGEQYDVLCVDITSNSDNHHYQWIKCDTTYSPNGQVNNLWNSGPNPIFIDDNHYLCSKYKDPNGPTVYNRWITCNYNSFDGLKKITGETYQYNPASEIFRCNSDGWTPWFDCDESLAGKKYWLPEDNYAPYLCDGTNIVTCNSQTEGLIKNIHNTEKQFDALCTHYIPTNTSMWMGCDAFNDGDEGSDITFKHKVGIMSETDFKYAKNYLCGNYTPYESWVICGKDALPGTNGYGSFNGMIDSTGTWKCDGTNGWKSGEFWCNDRKDNNDNGLFDCNDPSCDGLSCEQGGAVCKYLVVPQYNITPQCVETTCNDGKDNDNDGLIDCKDIDCNGINQCEYATELTCNDRKDNDGDDPNIYLIFDTNITFVAVGDYQANPYTFAGFATSTGETTDNWMVRSFNSVKNFLFGRSGAIAGQAGTQILAPEIKSGDIVSIRSKSTGKYCHVSVTPSEGTSTIVCNTDGTGLEEGYVVEHLPNTPLAYDNPLKLKSMKTKDYCYFNDHYIWCSTPTPIRIELEQLEFTVSSATQDDLQDHPIYSMEEITLRLNGESCSVSGTYLTCGASNSQDNIFTITKIGTYWCQSDNDCINNGNNKVCVMDVCSLNKIPPELSCNTNSDCYSNRCISGFCSGKIGDQCSPDPSQGYRCGPGLACVGQGICASTEPDCLSDSDCTAPKTCARHKCELPVINFTLLPQGGTDCFDTDCKGKKGIGGSNCCFSDNDCQEGTTCGPSHQCIEMNCQNGLDEDMDNSTDCQDPDCERVRCGGTDRDPKVCYNSKCQSFAKAGNAPVSAIPNITFITYSDLLNFLHKGIVIKADEPSSCNLICFKAGLVCGFAQGGMNTCSETGSTKCTCYGSSDRINSIGIESDGTGAVPINESGEGSFPINTNIFPEE